jgi:hypothetical protein
VPHAVSTALFSLIRSDTDNYRPPNGDWELAFREFRDIDVGNENVFLRDTRTAIDRVVAGKEAAGPSFERFRQTLVQGRLFAIVTARGHAPGIIRQGVVYFIDTVLTSEERACMLANLRGYLACFDPDHGLETDAEVLDHYLLLNRYHAVMSPAFKQLMGPGAPGSPHAEGGKQFAIRDFVEHVMRIAGERGLVGPISVGFSDDDVSNVQAVEEYVRKTLAAEFPSVKFVVYYTNDPDIPSGRKVVVHGQLTLDLEP